MDFKLLRISRIFILYLLVFALAGCSLEEVNSIPSSSSSAGQSEGSEELQKVQVKVDRVIDGDSVVVSLHGQNEKVRFIGVDTPETVHPEKGEQPFGKESSNYTKSRLEGQTIELEFDVQERDQYGRILAYIWIEDEHFNLTLVQEGYAVASTWPPNVKYADLYKTAQRAAREAEKGLWGIEDISEEYQVGHYKIDPASGLPVEKVNINTATNIELQLIPGIGESLAERIIQYRSNSLFQDVKELTKVKGIGAATLEKMLPYITI